MQTPDSGSRGLWEGVVCLSGTGEPRSVVGGAVLHYQG